VSVQAITWVLEDAPGLPPHLVGTLLGLANHADRHGRGAFPSQATLAWYARKTDRAVRKDLDQLTGLELIRRGDQRLVNHLPADERPVVWDLAMERKRQKEEEKDRNPSSGRKPKGTGTTVPAPRRGDDHKGPELQFPPINGTDRNHSSAPSDGGTGTPVQRDRNYSSKGTGTTVPTNRPLNRPRTSSSAPARVITAIAVALDCDEDEAEKTYRQVLSERTVEAPSRYIATLIDSGDIHAFHERACPPTKTSTNSYTGPTHRYEDDGDGNCQHCPLPHDNPRHEPIGATA